MADFLGISKSNKASKHGKKFHLHPPPPGTLDSCAARDAPLTQQTRSQSRNHQALGNHDHGDPPQASRQRRAPSLVPSSSTGKKLSPRWKRKQDGPSSIAFASSICLIEADLNLLMQVVVACQLVWQGETCLAKCEQDPDQASTLRSRRRALAASHSAP